MGNTDITANILATNIISLDNPNLRAIMKSIDELLTNDKARSIKRGRRNV